MKTLFNQFRKLAIIVDRPKTNEEALQRIKDFMKSSGVPGNWTGNIDDFGEFLIALAEKDKEQFGLLYRAYLDLKSQDKELAEGPGYREAGIPAIKSIAMALLMLSQSAPGADKKIDQAFQEAKTTKPASAPSRGESMTLAKVLENSKDAEEFMNNLRRYLVREYKGKTFTASLFLKDNPSIVALAAKKGVKDLERRLNLTAENMKRGIV